jgi:hypothetical protein
MDLAVYVDNLHKQLAVAAEAGGEESLALAERLATQLDSAVRLTLLEALSAAADEITRDLAPGSVELRLRGGEPGFAVNPPQPDRAREDRADSAATSAPPPSDRSSDTDEGATTRINFRLSDQLKARVELAANREGLSVNAWLVRVAAAAAQPADRSRRTSSSEQHYTGWVR